MLTWSNNRVAQLAFSVYSHNKSTWVRYKHDGTWSDWVRLTDTTVLNSAISSHTHSLSTLKALGVYSNIQYSTSTSDTKGWKVIGTFNATSKKAHILRFFTTSHSEGTGYLFINAQYINVSTPQSCTMMYIGSNLGTVAFTKFRITADTSSEAFAGTIYLEAYLNNVSQNHVFQFEDLNGGMAFESTLTDSAHQYVYSEIDVSKAGLCLSKPLDVNQGGTGVTTLDAFLRYGTDGTAGMWDKQTATPTATNAIRYNGYLRATRVYGMYYSESADYAEAYEVEGDIEEGELVMIAEGGRLIRNNIYANPKVLGIVSTQPASVIGYKDEGSIPIAMSGRVPVNVIGECLAGDFLVGSRIPGALERAGGNTPKGAIVAQALEDKSDSNKVMALVIRI